MPLMCSCNSSSVRRLAVMCPQRKWSGAERSGDLAGQAVSLEREVTVPKNTPIAQSRVPRAVWAMGPSCWDHGVPSTSNVCCSTGYRAEVLVTVRLPSSESAVQYLPMLILRLKSSHAVTSYCVSRVDHHPHLRVVTSACRSLRSDSPAMHALCVRPHTSGLQHPCV